MLLSIKLTAAPPLAPSTATPHARIVHVVQPPLRTDCEFKVCRPGHVAPELMPSSTLILSHSLAVSACLSVPLATIVGVGGTS